MSYESCENALKALIEGVDGYDQSNISQGDYRVLGQGRMVAVVLNPGSFDSKVVAERVHQRDWQINIELFLGYQGDVSDLKTAIRQERQKVIDHIDKYPTLGGTEGVVLARITGGDEPEVWKIGVRNFWLQKLRCTVQERAQVSYAE